MIDYDRSFASSDKSQYWSSKNLCKPTDVYLSSGKKFFFDCSECKHTFLMNLDAVKRGNWCPYCGLNILCDDVNCELCFEKSFASSEKSIYFSKINEVNPRKIFKTSGKKYFFDCSECNHTFESQLDNIKKGIWCNFCSNKQLCKDFNCSICFAKSFASNEKSILWSSKNKVTPRDVFQKTHDKYFFDCSNCKHTFQIRLSDICRNKGCNFCSNKQLCKDVDCTICFDKSFASHPKSKFWSKNNKVQPRDLLKYSNQKIEFNCEECLHSFKSVLSSISSGKWCAYCANLKICLNNDCQICFNKSFASNPKSIFWINEKNLIHPRQVNKNSEKKYWFHCDKCTQDFYNSPSIITYFKTWCPYCVNKTELKLFEQLKQYYPDIVHQFKVDWCKSKKYLPFDFCIPSEKIIIELDGPQHFTQVSNWSPPEFNIMNDKYKMNLANQNGYNLIRILQEDVHKDNYDWMKELLNSIQKVKTISVNIFLCKNNEYINHLSFTSSE